MMSTHESNDSSGRVRTVDTTLTEAQYPPKPMGLRHAFHFRNTPLPWRKSLSAGITLFIPLFVFSLIGHPLWGLLAAMGGFTSVYVIDEALPKLSMRLATVALGLVTSFGLGSLSAASVWSMAVVVAVVAGLASFFNNALRVKPPGAFFYILACAIGTGMPVDPSATPTRVGFALIGAATAWAVSITSQALWSKQSTTNGLSIIGPLLRIQAALRWESIVLPAAIRVAVGIFAATWIAYAFGNARPYWVAVGCGAVLQGATVIATVHRAVQRTIGTSLGILVAGVIFLLHPSYLWMAVCVLVLQSLVELFIGRNYALAVVFITPLALVIAETANAGMPPFTLVSARLVDNLLGCGIGLLAGLTLWRTAASARLQTTMANVLRAQSHLLGKCMEKGWSDGTIRTLIHELEIRLADLDTVYQSALQEYPVRRANVEWYWPVVLQIKHLSKSVDWAVEHVSGNVCLSKYGDSTLVKGCFEQLAGVIERDERFTLRLDAFEWDECLMDVRDELMKLDACLATFVGSEVSHL